MRYDIRISCEWKPRLRKKRYWEASVSTYTNDIHQRSYLVPWHQQCGCGSAGGGPDIGLLQITAPDITLREPYLLTDDGLHLHTVGITVRTDGVVAYTGWEGTGGFDLQDELHRSWRTDRYELERKLVGMLVEHPHWLTYGVYPQHLRFLSGHSPEERVRVEFREIRDNPAMPPEPALSR